MTLFVNFNKNVFSMSSAEIVVKTCATIPCGIPFDMKPIKIYKNNTETIWYIENGTAKQTENAEECEEEENFEKKVVYDNHEIRRNRF